MKIGIVGNGFVGSSVAYGFSAQTGYDSEVRIYDKDIKRSTDTLYDVVSKSDFIFVSVPTPSNENGSVNLDIVKQAFSEMNEINERTDNIFLLRSTVTPGTTRGIQESCPNLNIVFNPEFLTERSAKFDFINQSRFILGGEKELTDAVGAMFQKRFGFTTPIIKTDYETAELVKYMNNCFFATKVSFLNEMFQVAKLSGANWDEAIEGFVRDGRIGHSHLSVPGPDGNFGFGGSCFPKDVQAMIHYTQSIGIDPKVLQSIWDKNLEIRKDRNWSNMIGRAVTDMKGEI